MAVGFLLDGGFCEDYSGRLKYGLDLRSINLIFGFNVCQLFHYGLDLCAIKFKFGCPRSFIIWIGFMQNKINYRFTRSDRDRRAQSLEGVSEKLAIIYKRRKVSPM